MSSPHANHQGEPGDRGTKWVLVPREPTEEMIFAASGIRPGDLGYPAKSHMLRFDYRVMIASAPTPPDRVGEEVGREDLRHEATFLLARLRDFESELTDEQARDWYGHVTPSMERLHALASAPSPEAGAGGDLGELEDLVGRARLAALSEHTLYGNEAGSLYDDLADAIVDLLSDRSGKLVASTGSGEETKGEPPAGSGSREPGQQAVPASGFDPSRGFAEIAAKQVTLGLGLVDITIICHEGKTGVLFSRRAEHVEFGAGGIIQAGDYWPTADDIVLWVDGEGPGVAISYLSQLPPAPCDGSAEGGETGTGSTEGNSAVREAEASR